MGERSSVLMTIIILVMTSATIAIAAFVLAPRVADGRVVFDTTGDHPKAFGYQMAWFAIRTRDTAGVVERLGLTGVIACNWNNGLGAVYSHEHGASHVFVSPPVNGWTFVAGLALPQPMGKAFVDKSIPLLLDLGSQFIEVQYYVAYPALDYFAWARVIDGRIVRAYAITDQGVIWNKGKPSKEEKFLGIKLYEVRGEKKRRGNAGTELVLYPTEAHVLQLAGKWSLDPSRLDGMTASAPHGNLGEAPARWRAERLRRTG